MYFLPLAFISHNRNPLSCPTSYSPDEVVLMELYLVKIWLDFTIQWGMATHSCTYSHLQYNKKYEIIGYINLYGFYHTVGYGHTQLHIQPSAMELRSKELLVILICMLIFCYRNFANLSQTHTQMLFILNNPVSYAHLSKQEYTGYNYMYV